MIGLFVPENFEEAKLDYSILNKYFKHRIQYASKGRWALAYIMEELKTHNLDADKVMVPAYFCKSILETLKKVDLKPILYDLDIRDLNPDCDSIAEVLKKNCQEVLCVIVPSFYGNPADLETIQSICKKNNVKVIDDAAQSFGAKLNGKNVGSFGDAGIMAFSPGKPTALHMGSFFWGVEKNIIQKKHNIPHYIAYQNYIYNRRDIYTCSKLFRQKMLSLANRIVERCFDLSEDAMSSFEAPIIGGCIQGTLSVIDERNSIRNEFINRFGNNDIFRVVSNIRGSANPCKIVLMFNQIAYCEEFKRFLNKKEIKYYGGYDPLNDEGYKLGVTRMVINRLVELPIELNKKHMSIIFDAVENYLEGRDKL